jgi:hypothetical protein
MTQALTKDHSGNCLTAISVYVDDDPARNAAEQEVIDAYESLDEYDQHALLLAVSRGHCNQHYPSLQSVATRYKHAPARVRTRGVQLLADMRTRFGGSTS